jgi:multiple sugar transport system ATP-binding protein
MTMGTRIAILNAGELQQIDTPQNLYALPNNKFVAGFIGSPAMNFFEVALTEQDGQLTAKSDTIHVPLPRSSPAVYREYIGQRVILGIRPEDIHDASYVPPGIAATPIKGTVSNIEMMGNEVIVYLALPTGEDCVARVDRRSDIARGQAVALMVDPAAIHLFNPHTEATIRQAA